METVNPLRYIAPISSSGSHDRRRGQDFQPPQPGQLLQAKVTGAQGQYRFELDFGPMRLNVVADTQLSIGQTLQLRVTSISPRLTLEIVNDNLPLLIGRSLTLLDHNLDLHDLLTSLRSPPGDMGQAFLSPASRDTLNRYYTLQHDPPASWDNESGKVLKELINTLGLQMERLLAAGDKDRALQTLKSSLYDVQHSFSTADNIAQTANRLLATIELMQLIQLQAGNDSLFILPLPFPFLEKAYLVVEYKNKNDRHQPREDEPTQYFSLHLTVQPLGHLRIDLQRIEKTLQVRFRAQTQEMCDYIRTYQEELKEAISGFADISITFSPDSPDPIHELIQHLAPNGHPILDMTI